MRKSGTRRSTSLPGSDEGCGGASQFFRARVFLLLVTDVRAAQLGFGQWMLLGVPVTLITLPVVYFVLTRARYAIQGKIFGVLLQFITGISKLRVAGAEGQAYTLWAHQFSEEKQLHMRTETIGNGLRVFNAVFPTLSAMALFATMAFWLKGNMSTGAFLAFNTAWGTFLAAMLNMASSILSTLEIVPIYERAKPILEAVPEVDTTRADPGPLSGRAPKIPTGIARNWYSRRCAAWG